MRNAPPSVTEQSMHGQARGAFVTGTDTGVGKTAVAAAVLTALARRGLTIGAFKPIETGCGPSLVDSDVERLKHAAQMPDPTELICPYRFPAPLAPRAAAEAAACPVQPQVIERAFQTLAGRYRCLLVEGVGGLRVPIAEKFDVADLIAHLGLPVIVVGRAALGGVNHALLTLEALERRQLPVLALILNQPHAAEERARQQRDATVSLLRELAGVPVLGSLPHVPSFPVQWETAVRTLSFDPAIEAMADLITAGS
jgi:dethiobiotin synthetase